MSRIPGIRIMLTGPKGACRDLDESAALMGERLKFPIFSLQSHYAPPNRRKNLISSPTMLATIT